MQLVICSRRAERFLRLLYLLGTTVVASCPGAADDLAAVPGPPENSADIVKRTSIMMAKPPNAMNTHVSRKLVAANWPFDERTSTALPFGNNATRLAALILGWDRARRRERQRFNQLGQPHGSRFPRHPRKARGFFLQGSTSSRASAERTLSPVPFRSSPIDAPRNWSNSGPMSRDSAAWVILLPLPFTALLREGGHKPSPLRAPFELLAPDPIHSACVRSVLPLSTGFVRKRPPMSASSVLSPISAPASLRPGGRWRARLP